jgi:hypothetical protein
MPEERNDRKASWLLVGGEHGSKTFREAHAHNLKGASKTSIKALDKNLHRRNYGVRPSTREGRRTEIKNCGNLNCRNFYRNFGIGRVGIEPTTLGLRVPCSTN